MEIGRRTERKDSMKTYEVIRGETLNETSKDQPDGIRPDRKLDKETRDSREAHDEHRQEVDHSRGGNRVPIGSDKIW